MSKFEVGHYVVVDSTSSFHRYFKSLKGVIFNVNIFNNVEYYDITFTCSAEIYRKYKLCYLQKIGDPDPEIHDNRVTFNTVFKAKDLKRHLTQVEIIEYKKLASKKERSLIDEYLISKFE